MKCPFRPVVVTEVSRHRKGDSTERTNFENCYAERCAAHLVSKAHRASVCLRLVEVEVDLDELLEKEEEE